jgi:hypothetical protein
VTPVIPLRRDSGVREFSISRGSDEWKPLYRGRSAVEREFGSLKHHYALAMLRVRGVERVRLHADLTVLARLGVALGRAGLQRLSQPVGGCGLRPHHPSGRVEQRGRFSGRVKYRVLGYIAESAFRALP